MTTELHGDLLLETNEGVTAIECRRENGNSMTAEGGREDKAGGDFIVPCCSLPMRFQDWPENAPTTTVLNSRNG